jgi:hypothetical protein
MMRRAFFCAGGSAITTPRVSGPRWYGSSSLVTLDSLGVSGCVGAGEVSHEPFELLLLSFTEVGLKLFDDDGNAITGDVARPYESFVTARYALGDEELGCGDVDPQHASYDIGRDAWGPVMGFVDRGGHSVGHSFSRGCRVSVETFFLIF